MTQATKIKNIIFTTLGGIGVCAGFNIYNQSEKFYDEILVPASHMLNPETSHNVAVFLHKYRLIPKSQYNDPPTLNTKFFNMKLSNPIGIGAGFDKQGEAVKGLIDIGFGFVEIGSVTPLPQSGNPKPRVFRLPEDKAVINRYGFNSDGHEKVLERLNKLKNENVEGVIGVNLGKNKLAVDAVQDYVEGIKKFGRVADYLVINISSPNTPSLRNLQGKELLSEFLEEVIEARNNLTIEKKPPLLLKLAPDLSFQEKKDIANVLSKRKCHVDGLIISNTTVSRDDLTSNQYKEEEGGLSGKPLKDMSTQMIADMYKLTNGSIPIIGVGGVFTGQDAYDKIRAGASAVQLYTAYIYHGPPRVTKIKKELDELLVKDGFINISQAIGSGVQKK